MKSKKYLYQISAVKQQKETVVYFATSKAQALYIAKTTLEKLTLANKKVTVIIIRRYDRKEFQELYFSSYCEVIARIMYKK